MSMYPLYVLKAKLVQNSLVESYRQSKLKMVVIVTFMFGFTIGLFFLFWEAFYFLASLEPTVAEIIIDRLMYLFFFSIFVMFIVSSALVSFSTLYKSPEVSYLLEKPIAFRQIVTMKLFETVILSSWAFLFVVGPFALAYGIFIHAGLMYYLAWGVLFPPFILIGSIVGTLFVVFIVRWYSPVRMKWLLICVLTFGAVILGFYYFRMRSIVSAERGNIILALNTLIPHFRYSQHPFMPSYWMCESLLMVVRGAFGQGMFYFFVLLSNALFLMVIIQEAGTRLFYTGWVRVQTTDRTKHYTEDNSIIERMVFPVRRWLSSVRYALLIKDMKIFWRDPAQWLQCVIFFGLLGIYFSNLQNFSYHMLKPIMKQFTSLCNVSAMMLVMASMTVRFVYPHLSLEGKKIWLVGIAPIHVRTIFYQHYGFSVLWLSVLSMVLMLISNQKLQIDPLFAYYSYGVVLCMSVTLVSMGCGFGALFPHFKEDNPARLVAGFGGTLLFVLSLTYISIIVFFLAWPFRIYFSPDRFTSQVLMSRLCISGFCIIGISVLGSILPVILGIRALQRMEF